MMVMMMMMMIMMMMMMMMMMPTVASSINQGDIQQILFVLSFDNAIFATKFLLLIQKKSDRFYIKISRRIYLQNFEKKNDTK